MLIEFKNKTEINTQQLYKLNKKVIEKLPLVVRNSPSKSHQQSQQGLAEPCIQRLLLLS